MADGIGNLIGGFAQGIAQGKQQGQQQRMMEEYRKAQTDLIKIEAKKAETALKLQEFQAPIFQAIGEAAKGGGMGAPPVAMVPQPAPAISPMSQPVPQAPKTSLPMEIAQGQITIPGSPEGNISVRQNNPFNLKYVGQEGATGAGSRGFAIFPTPEAGVMAGLKQLQLDQSRGLTFGQFAEKYAPSFENPGWAADVAKLTGATPDTPLAQIPLPTLAKAVAQRESSTDITPMLGGAPQQPPQQAPQMAGQPVQFGAQTGITGQKLLEGFLKKNFGVDPDEAHVVPYGDHKLVVNKKGQPLGIIAGQGKTELIDVKLPDGSIVKRPMLVPPSPLPGGIPVINLPGQAQGGSMGQGGIQTAPPEYKYEEVASAGGGKQKIPVPAAQPGGAPIQTEPPGLKPADMGRMNMVMQADNRIKEINSMLFPDNKINRELILKAAAPMGGIGEGATLQSKMYQAVDSALRLETGAQANEQEIKTKMKQYWPSVKDTDDAIRKKVADLTEYVNGVVKLGDPTGEIRKMRGGPAKAASGASTGIPQGATPTGRTSGGKPVYKLPSGQLWVQ